jgi:hypothetical protein
VGIRSYTESDARMTIGEILIWESSKSTPADPRHDRAGDVKARGEALGEDNVSPSHLDNLEKVVICDSFSQLVSCEWDDRQPVSA